MRPISCPASSIATGPLNAGIYFEYFVGSASKIVATDLSEHMITVARSRFNDQATVTVETTDCFKLPHLSHDVNPSR
ncbi:MAG: hypothetical protein HRU22_00275 [Gammaproteobacteria bacterium]|nr:hypothetical protein [Gammaproteobacteria bacterium]